MNTGNGAFDRAMTAAVKAHLKEMSLPKNRWYSPHLFIHAEKPNRHCYYCLKLKPSGRRGKK